MRVLHAVDSLNPAGGGVTECVIQLSALGLRAGHSIEVVSLDEPAAPWLAALPFAVHALGPTYLSYAYSPRLTLWLREHRHRFDVVIVHGLWKFIGLGVWLALRHTDTPYCVFTHGMLDPWFKRHYPLKHLKKWLYWPWADYRMLRDAMAVLFTTEEEHDQSLQTFWLYRCKPLVVAFGINEPPGDHAAQREVFLEAFPELRKKRLLLFLGRLHEKKGCDLLLMAFANLSASGSSPGPQTGLPLELVMAGPVEPGYGKELQDLAEKLGINDRVTWTGSLSGDLKWGAYAAADAFVLPSHQENFGIAVAEALAMGLPVLISNRVNIWREIQAADAGWVESDDVEGTGRLLMAWSRCDPATWLQKRQNAQRCFETCFDLDQLPDTLAKVFERLDQSAVSQCGAGDFSP